MKAAVTCSSSLFRKSLRSASSLWKKGLGFNSMDDQTTEHHLRGRSGMIYKLTLTQQSSFNSLEHTRL